MTPGERGNQPNTTRTHVLQSRFVWRLCEPHTLNNRCGLRVERSRPARVPDELSRDVQFFGSSSTQPIAAAHLPVFPSRLRNFCFSVEARTCRVRGLPLFISSF